MNTDDSGDKVELLLVDDQTDFNFHAAYVAYSSVWNESSNETRMELNNLMHALVENHDYSTFYRELNRYRNNLSSDYSRARFKTQRKRAWRKSEAKKVRLSRHKR